MLLGVHCARGQQQSARYEQGQVQGRFGKPGQLQGMCCEHGLMHGWCSTWGSCWVHAVRWGCCGLVRGGFRALGQPRGECCVLGLLGVCSAHRWLQDAGCEHGGCRACVAHMCGLQAACFGHGLPLGVCRVLCPWAAARCLLCVGTDVGPRAVVAPSWAVAVSMVCGSTLCPSRNLPPLAIPPSPGGGDGHLAQKA